jgi:hypothetical protein
MKKIFLLAAACSIVELTHAQNILQLGWDFNGNAGNELSVATTFNNPDLETSSIVRGAGLSAASLANSFSATGWTTTNSLADAIINNDYLQFTIKAETSFITSLSGLDAIFRRSGTGPDRFQWQFSVDGTSFINISNEISFTSTATNGVAQSLIDLTAISGLQSVVSSTTITIRLYGYNATASGGSFSVGRLAGNDLALTGSTNSITPVRLLNFSGKLVKNSIELRWVTASEINNSRYEIEHSVDGKRFGKIGELYSANAINGSSYFFRVDNVKEGNNWYRLKIVDVDGRFEYSAVILISYKELSVLKIFHSPATRQILVRYPATDQLLIFKILGLNGILYQQYYLPARSSELTITVGNLPAGSYILVWINEGSINSSRFVNW